jgi:acetyl-CoA carboxylase carboxyltransferase component
MDRFSRASPSARIQGIIDSGSFIAQPVRDNAALCVGKARFDGQPVWIVATDSGVSRGAIGVAEGEAIIALLRAARAEPHPIIWIIDSAGAKVTEGIRALGVFRQLYGEALTTCLSGVPMLALLGRACFGGASLLAAVAQRRVYSEHTLFAVSGPGVIQALVGKDQLDAKDPAQVRTLMSGPARAQISANEFLAEDSAAAFRDAARNWLKVTEAPSLTEEHRTLGKRLSQIGADPLIDMRSACLRLQDMTPAGYVVTSRGAMVKAQAPGKPLFLGTLTGQPVGAELCWILADELLAGMRVLGPPSPVILLLDAAGHAASPRDERVMLSSYLAHLALVIATLVKVGHRVVLWITGTASGASYVAFAAGAQQVSALPKASIRILPKDAVREIVGRVDDDEINTQELIEAHVIDALLDQRIGVFS